ncbi:hypothetical protein JOC77_000909 [Peribacillus deserti]|uniref:J domain-containing protein n=1 Tax=Peribacillus deserti TaxID=673318 RepID=A0ABS2QFM3_9BACI|nr:hypothetical protein [Peribacillus deserti]MBM7691504.1 hypothetical protein [Peribacillus deserti]
MELQRDYELLKQEIELLRTSLHISETKVHSLKKMLKAEYEMSSDKPQNYKFMLGLDQSVDNQAVKREFKQLLKALHPDRGGDERLFKVFSDHYSKIKF